MLQRFSGRTRSLYQQFQYRRGSLVATYGARVAVSSSSFTTTITARSLFHAFVTSAKSHPLVSSASSTRTPSSLFHAFVTTAKSRPLATAIVFATSKGVLADLLAQLYVEGRRLPSKSNETDEALTYNWRRTASLATFSGLYCGAFFYWQFSVLFPRIWPVNASYSWRSVLAQVGLDNGFFSPCLYLPTFFIINGAFCHGETPNASVRRYADEFGNVVWNLLTIWVPAGLVNFALMPVWFRAPFNASVSFFYLIFLSIQAQNLATKSQCSVTVTVPTTMQLSQEKTSVDSQRQHTRFLDAVRLIVAELGIDDAHTLRSDASCIYL